jgi:hypothetical protein
MPRRNWFALAALGACWLAAAPAQAQNLLANPGFEDPVTYDGPPFVGSWEAFNAGPGSSAANSSALPRSGAQHLALSIIATDNSFAGAFQDVPGMVPGLETIFSGYHMTISDPFDVGVEIRIEWRNSVSNTEVARTPNLTPIPPSQYGPFSLVATVPAGADTARVVYAIQSFGPQPTNTGTVYVDDVSFVIPEPAAIGSLALGACLLPGRRRR